MSLLGGERCAQNYQLFAPGSGSGYELGRLIHGRVVQHFTDVLGGATDTKEVITLGTPFRGAVKALGVLSRGWPPWLPGIRSRCRRLARTLPSVYELLPRYQAVVEGSERRTVAAADLDPTESGGPFERAGAFRAALDTPGTRPYGRIVITRSLEPTPQFARVENERHGFSSAGSRTASCWTSAVTGRFPARAAHVRSGSTTPTQFPGPTHLAATAGWCSGCCSMRSRPHPGQSRPKRGPSSPWTSWISFASRRSSWIQISYFSWGLRKRLRRRPARSVPRSSSVMPYLPSRAGGSQECGLIKTGKCGFESDANQ